MLTLTYSFQVPWVHLSPSLFTALTVCASTGWLQASSWTLSFIMQHRGLSLGYVCRLGGESAAGCGDRLLLVTTDTYASTTTCTVSYDSHRVMEALS